MEVSLETTEGLERRLTVRLPGRDFHERYEARLASLAKTVRINGFRRGKVPLKVVRQRYGASARDEVLAELVEQSYRRILQERKLVPAAPPRIDAKAPADAEAELEYTAVFEVLPEFELADLSGLEIKRPQVEITEADVDETIERLRAQAGEWRAVERPAAAGDRVRIDYQVSVAGERRSEADRQDALAVLEEGGESSEFVRQLLGIAAGERRQVTVTMPEDHQDEALRGKAVTFEVECKAVEELVKPPLDEAFVRRFDIEDGNLETLRARVRRQLEHEARRAVRERLRRQVLDGLIALNPIELPKTMVAQRAEWLRRVTARQLGLKPELADRLPLEHFQEAAARQVHLQLLTEKVREAFDLKLDRAQVERLIAEEAADYQDPEAMVEYFRSNEGELRRFISQALEDQVIDAVLGRAEVIDEPTPFAQLMGKA
ncbi:MAG: trigger factor [Gammaproteobacteria bacterium]|nr:MAG: trigger factor [Gammaproteobacteria bacterium]